jgi:hypothetical protein
MKKPRSPLSKSAGILVMVLLAQMFFAPQTSSAIDWKIKKNQWRKQTGGYLLNTSIERGKTVSLFVSCPAKSYMVSVLKVGNFAGAETQEVKKTSDIACINQSQNPTVSWKSNTEIDTSKLTGGMYLIKISDTDGFKSFIPLIIRDAKQKARALFVVPTMTMFAYNSWQGSNTYEGKNGFKDRSRVVDFRMPFDAGFGTGKYWSYVHPLIVELEKTKLDIMYVADTDIHFYPELLKNRTLYVSAGHDEYWTKQERESVIQARLNGMNLIFFGANAGYWQTRLSKVKTTDSIVMEIYKDKTEDPNKKEPTIKFRDGGYSESELNGVQYTCFPARGDFKSFDTTFFGFKGLLAKDFTNIGNLLGPEVDETPGTNKFLGTIKVVAEGKVKCGNRWIFPKTGRASMVYGTSATGGGVFSVGTMGWVLNGLGGGTEKAINYFVVTVTNNVVKRGIQGPFK